MWEKLFPVFLFFFVCLFQNKDGTIDFREYVIGVTVLCQPVNTEETIQMAFQVQSLRCSFWLGGGRSNSQKGVQQIKKGLHQRQETSELWVDGSTFHW